MHLYLLSMSCKAVPRVPLMLDTVTILAPLFKCFKLSLVTKNTPSTLTPICLSKHSKLVSSKGMFAEFKLAQLNA